jgi:hypothetical protein
MFTNVQIKLVELDRFGGSVISSVGTEEHQCFQTQQVAKSRGQRCGDIELAGYLANVAGPVPLVLDLRISVGEVALNLVLMDTYITLTT